MATFGCGSLVGVAATIGYAASSKENRQAVDAAIPGVPYLTAAVLGAPGKELFPDYHHPQPPKKLTPLYEAPAKADPAVEEIVVEEVPVVPDEGAVDGLLDPPATEKEDIPLPRPVPEDMP